MFISSIAPSLESKNTSLTERLLVFAICGVFCTFKVAGNKSSFIVKNEDFLSEHFLYGSTPLFYPFDPTPFIFWVFPLSRNIGNSNEASCFERILDLKFTPGLKGNSYIYDELLKMAHSTTEGSIWFLLSCFICTRVRLDKDRILDWSCSILPFQNSRSRF